MTSERLRNSDSLFRADFPYLTPLRQHEKRYGDRVTRWAFVHSASLPSGTEILPDVDRDSLEVGKPITSDAVPRRRQNATALKVAPDRRPLQSKSVSQRLARQVTPVVAKEQYQPNPTQADIDGPPPQVSPVLVAETGYPTALPEKFDLAISVAGPDREHARELAIMLQQAGYTVFYDELYADALWGADLALIFDDIFRKRSRYCIIFISKAYRDSVWTIYEVQCALARALEEKGEGYILPIKIDDTELRGIRPTISYVSIKSGIAKISNLLIKKLKFPIKI